MNRDKIDAYNAIEEFIICNVFIDIKDLAFKEMKFTKEEKQACLNSDRWNRVFLRDANGKKFEVLLTKRLEGLKSVRLCFNRFSDVLEQYVHTENGKYLKIKDL